MERAQVETPHRRWAGEQAAVLSCEACYVVEWRSLMPSILLILALLSGGLTVVFILAGLQRACTRHQQLGARALAVTAVFSLLTAAFTLWQLVLVAQQVHFPR